MSTRSAARAALVARLEAAGSLSAATIRNATFRPLSPEDCPAIDVYLGNETARTDYPSHSQREAEVVVVITVNDTSDPQSELDTFVEAVEAVIGDEDRPSWLPNSTISFSYRGLTVAPEREGSRVTLSAALDYRLLYQTTQGTA